MANINGIPIENISNMKGVAASTIQSISGIATSALPGWPGGGPTCSDLPLSYGFAPGRACGGDASFYSFDATNNQLYQYGFCGNEDYYAEPGFYVDNGIIYEWTISRTGTSWEEFGICE